MDYEKKYKEALERAREYHSVDIDNTMDIKARGIMEYLFPELKESEDEQIRKALIGFLRNNPSGNYTCEEMATWLEKQDPKKHEEELEKAYKTADKVQYRRGYEAATKEMEKQGEQKPVWSEDDELSLYDTKEAIINYWHGQSQEDLLEWLKSLKDRYTWKPSDKQMKVLISEVEGWTKGCPKQKVLESLYNDLKNLK